jgi:4-alpha-glucanotransferase
MRSQRYSLLGAAADRALRSGIAEFEDFMQLSWVQEWSWFAAKKEMNKGKPWTQWKNTAPVTTDSLRAHGMIQFFFNTQWMKLREYCNSLGISILGDIPIYSAHDSTDVFFNRDLFKLSADGSPAAVAGVPPDYFSRTGQLWGNPVYDWDQCARSGYRLWTGKMTRALNLYDAVRIDHFRAFDMYWEISAGETTAENGKWIAGPGIELFRRMESSLGRLPVVAEDLGLVSPSVHALRKQCGFPGMIVLQFALQNNDFSIDDIDPSSVIYTGTHDNNTTAGWIKAGGGGLGFGSARSVIDLALSSPADLAVIPMQDILDLDSSARMNTPASPAGNWRWRMIEMPRSAGSFARR